MLFPGKLPEQYLLNSSNGTSKTTIARLPKKTCQDNVVTVVKTAIWNSKLRIKVRKLAKLHDNYTNIFFLVGQTGSNDDDKQMDDKLQKESEQHHDLIYGNFFDTYTNLPLKTFLGYDFFLNYCKSSPALIVQDDDALVNYRAIRSIYKENLKKHEISTLCLESSVSCPLTC